MKPEKLPDSKKSEGIDLTSRTRLLSFVEELKLRNSKLVMTYRAKDALGNDFFAYILCDAAGVKKMKLDYLEQNERAAKDYGEVLHAAFLKDPDEEAIAILREWLNENGGEMLPKH
jgi:hypothetical protein